MEFEFSISSLTNLGYTSEQALDLVAMSPSERLAALPIHGDAMSDAPLFQTIHDVLTSNARLEIKQMALIRSYLAVGERPPICRSNDQIRQAVEDYVTEMAQ